MDIVAQPSANMCSSETARKSAKTIKLKTFFNSKSPSQRKSLQQLQPSAEDNRKLVGSDGCVRSLSQKARTPKRKRDGEGERPAKKQAKFITKPSKKFSVYTDETTAASTSTVEHVHKKTPEEEAYELMVQDNIPEKYWEDIAEERRVALENTLKENERLHIEVHELKEENQRLKVTADQAVYLAEVVQDLLGEKTEDEEGDDDKDGKREESSSEGEPEDESTENEVNDDRGFGNSCTEEDEDEDESDEDGYHHGSRRRSDEEEGRNIQNDSDAETGNSR